MHYIPRSVHYNTNYDRVWAAECFDVLLLFGRGSSPSSTVHCSRVTAGTQAYDLNITFGGSNPTGFFYILFRTGPQPRPIYTVSGLRREKIPQDFYEQVQAPPFTIFLSSASKPRHFHFSCFVRVRGPTYPIYLVGPYPSPLPSSIYGNQSPEKIFTLELVQRRTHGLKRVNSHKHTHKHSHAQKCIRPPKRSKVWVKQNAIWNKYSTRSVFVVYLIQLLHTWFKCTVKCVKGVPRVRDV